MKYGGKSKKTSSGRYLYCLNFKTNVPLQISIICSCLFEISDDHTRVKLLTDDDDETADYINANYIPVS